MLNCLSSIKLKNQVIFTKRSNVDIIYSILVIAKDGESRTHIMYKCNLSWTSLKKMIGLLMEQELIFSEDEAGKTTYKLTEKGKHAYEYFENMQFKINSPIVFVPTHEQNENTHG